MSNSPKLSLDLPVALVRIWASDRRWLHDIGQALAGSEGAPLQPVNDGLFAIQPASGDPNVVEAAVSMSRSLLSQVHSTSSATVLIFPGTVSIGQNSLHIVPGPLLQDLEALEPELEDRTVNLTSHAIYELESHWQIEESSIYRGPSGRELPIFSLKSPTAGRPFRNPELVGRPTPIVRRDNIERSLANHLGAPCLIVHGPIGCGKTRIVDRALRQRIHLYARPWTRRSGAPTLAKQLLDQLYAMRRELRVKPEFPPEFVGDGRSGWFSRAAFDTEGINASVIRALSQARHELPIPVFIDGMEGISSRDRSLVEELLRLSALGENFHLILSGRNAGPWTNLWLDNPRVAVPPFDANEMTSQCQNLFANLNMPDEIESHLFDMSKGFPFSLEEALIRMVRHKALRRVYGNYFYSGTPNPEVGPSARLARHLESEIRRLGSPLCLRILSHADASFLAEQVTSIATAIGDAPMRRWEEPYLEAGLIELITSSLGETLSLTCPLHGQAFMDSVTEQSSEALRLLVGRELATIGDEPSDHWKAYEMLAGTSDAPRVLVNAARVARTAEERERIFDALVAELEAHEARQGDEEAELAMLWVLLPLARRLGRLSVVGTAIDRAVELSEHQPGKMVALSALRADLEQNEGRLREAEQILLQGLTLARDTDDRRKAVLFVQLGKVLQRQGRNPEARKLFEDVLEILDRTGGTALAATCRFNLGNIALTEKRFETALEYHLEALKERTRRKLTHQIGASLSALGATHLALGNYPRALHYYREAEAMLDKHGREGEVSFAILGVGRTLGRLGDYQAASAALKRCLNLRQARDDRAGEAIARLMMAENHLNLGHSELALEEARKAHFSLSLGEASKHLGDAEQILGRIFMNQRHHEEARQHFEAAIQIHQQHGDVLAATFDRAWLLETSIAVSDHRRIEELCSALEAVMETLHYPELGETLDLRLYQGLEWLRQRGRDTDPLKALRRGYRELYRKTELLTAELRNPFLFQIPDNRAIVNAATLHGLTLD